MAHTYEIELCTVALLYIHFISSSIMVSIIVRQLKSCLLIILVWTTPKGHAFPLSFVSNFRSLLTTTKTTTIENPRHYSRFMIGKSFKCGKLCSKSDESRDVYVSSIKNRRTIIQSFCHIGLMSIVQASNALPLVSESVDNVNASLMFQNDGIPEVTSSKFGQLFRKKAIQGARVVDRLDEKWGRFSDGLRDEGKCDEETGRRIFDNGFRKDGTRVGNPVLGSLCSPIELKTLNESAVNNILLAAKKIAIEVNPSLTNNSLNDGIKNVSDRVMSSFQSQLMDRSKTPDERNRAEFNFKIYCLMRTFQGMGCTNETFEVRWGDALVKYLLNNDENLPTLEGNRTLLRIGRGLTDDDVSPQLVTSLEALGSCLDELRKYGIIGRAEINVPESSYGNVIIVAVDDDITIGSQVLLQEQSRTGFHLRGSIVTALCISLIDQTVYTYGIDVFFSDPSSTDQNTFNPNQLLVNISNIEKR